MAMVEAAQGLCQRSAIGQEVQPNRRGRPRPQDNACHPKGCPVAGARPRLGGRRPAIHDFFLLAPRKSRLAGLRPP